ncbi:MAG TPA: OmpH family outer membrane protein [Methylomusa anaerophila]|uniref:Outer membrane protein n=1 Tax=Methylomusa anaerophila TaxID=1930071 RepID=A0A348AL71_9FIRM|nr:OmpH family outer membrane protein [Methylomusa anaerophila]BBB91819.1 Outer membrane protein [Methylomusa anaerophila]HML88448.1 OmpH family outer membrane protein [Methylomusa anaerophila]
MKKIIKTISLLAVVFLLSGLAAPVPALAAKAKDRQETSIGYVNRQKIFAAYPGIQDIMNRIQTMRNEAQKDYDEHTKDLPPADKQAYGDKLSRQQEQQEDELMKPVSDKIAAAIQAIAVEKGLTVVGDAAIVVYGDRDITADVIAKVKR